MSQTQITSLEALQGYSKGQIVEFPPFAEGQPLVARIKRPSLLALAKSGKIPNSLLTTANGLFAGKGINTKSDSALPELFQILDSLCEASFIEPTYDQLKGAGLELTDEQLMFIFNYAQTGTKALEAFRGEPKNSQATVNIQEVPKASV